MKHVQRTPVLILALLASACGGHGDPASPALASAPVRDAAMSAPADAVQVPADARPVDSPRPAAPLALQEWLARLGRQHGLVVRADSAVAARPVAAALPTRRSADDIALALADFDLLLGYTRGGPGGAGLASVQVMPRGGTPARPLAAAPSATAFVAETDPVLALQRIQHELASGDPAVRSAALARSFELEAPLPAPVLAAALQSDASGEVRLYALMALARHPAVDSTDLRTLALQAAADADPAVRSHAAEVAERIDSLGRAD